MLATLGINQLRTRDKFALNREIINAFPHALSCPLMSGESEMSGAECVDRKWIIEETSKMSELQGIKNKGQLGVLCRSTHSTAEDNLLGKDPIKSLSEPQE